MKKAVVMTLYIDWEELSENRTSLSTLIQTLIKLPIDSEGELLLAIAQMQGVQRTLDAIAGFDPRMSCNICGTCRNEEDLVNVEGYHLCPKCAFEVKEEARNG